MSNEVSTTSSQPPLALSNEDELIAHAMLSSRGDLAKASRSDDVPYNAMALRVLVRNNPAIRARYHVLLGEEMQEKGLHIAERILAMAELQSKAFGGPTMVNNPVTGETEEIDIPADPKMVIDLSKEISRLISEGKGQQMSSKATMIIASKEDAEEILQRMLDS